MEISWGLEQQSACTPIQFLWGVVRLIQNWSSEKSKVWKDCRQHEVCYWCLLMVSDSLFAYSAGCYLLADHLLLLPPVFIMQLGHCSLPRVCWFCSTWQAANASKPQQQMQILLTTSINTSDQIVTVQCQTSMSDIRYQTAYSGILNFFGMPFHTAPSQLGDSRSYRSVFVRAPVDAVLYSARYRAAQWSSWHERYHRQHFQPALILYQAIHDLLKQSTSFSITYSSRNICVKATQLA